ncbi:MAG: hypothetical protein ACO1OB_09970 [Archangium sp.]
MFRRLLLSGLVFSSVAMAQGTEGPAAAPAAAVDSDTPEAKAAKELVQKYLTAVKARKWADAKKFLHPKTLEAIAERKKRLGKEDHPMAPWFHEKVDYWMKDFKVGAASTAPLGTIIVETTEDNFQVEEKGLAEGERSAYLVGKQGGKWFVVDKKRGETFTKDSVKLGYKGWFDKIEKAPEAAE